MASDPGRTPAGLLIAQAMNGGGIPPTGVLVQNWSRSGHAGITESAGPGSGVERLQGFWLPAGFVVEKLWWWTGSIALVPGTSPHAIVALHDLSRALLRQSTDDTGLTWAAKTIKSFTLSSPFTTTYSGLHYLGLSIVAGGGGTQPTLMAINSGSTQVVGEPPIIGGNSSSGLTATAPNPAAVITPTNQQMWCGVS